MLPGGRWFMPGESRVIILPTPLAAQLKVDPADVGKATVTFAGVPYKVIGLADPGILRSLIDLDGDGAMPADFSGGVGDLDPVIVPVQDAQLRAVVRGERALRVIERSAARRCIG